MTLHPGRHGSAGSHRTEVLIFLLLLVIGILAARYVMGETPYLSREAIVRIGVGRDLLDGFTTGRQGLVGSLYWGPLPTLLILPILRLPAPLGGDWAPTFVGIAAAALVCTFLSAWLRRCGLTTLTRFAIAVAVFLSPALQGPIMEGAAAPLFALFVVSASCCLMHWWETEELRSLAYLAISLALAILTRFQAVILVPIALILVAVHLYAYRRRRNYAEATLIVFLTPAVYVVSLWIMANWLIMGEPFFLLRGLPGRQSLDATWTIALSEGCDWGRAIYLAAIILVGWAVGTIMGKRPTLWTAVPLLAASVLLWTGPYSAIEPTPTQADSELRLIAGHIRTERSGDWVVVSGYRGYELARLLPDEGRGNVLRVLSFYPAQVIDKTRGRRAYVLVPRPTGADRWEDSNLKYPGVFHRGAPFTVYERFWKHWHLWRIVRMDDTDLR